ncbi:glycine-rich protein A3-like [Malus sylvestris]|uniref:glycine-rich protein A3-like n=1 Tax=Malus domestica TaxID=3750 RepID=UPI0021ABEF34|nr:glycine-rich protein A3-like [Malus sylvestris]XP_050155756.1 glycine-rich protein A3-like [Malus sylvestris]
MGGGKDEKHETTEKALFSYGSGYGSYPPQGYGYPPQAHQAYPSPGGYPPAAYPSYGGYPPTSYPPAGYSGHGAPGIGMGGMLAGVPVAAAPANGANHLVHGGGAHHGYGAYHGHGGSHDFGVGHGYGHGKFQHGKFGKPFGGKFNKWH